MFQRQKSDTKLRRTPSFFTEARHLAEPVEVQPSQEWRVKSTRTHGGVLAVCLNAEVEPPDLEPAEEEEPDTADTVPQNGRGLGMAVPRKGC